MSKVQRKTKKINIKIKNILITLNTEGILTALKGLKKKHFLHNRSEGWR